MNERTKAFLLALGIIFMPQVGVSDEYYSVPDPLNDQVIDCASAPGKIEPGKMIGNNNRFRRLSDSVTRLKKKVLRSGNSNSTLKKRVKLAVKEYKRQKRLCQDYLPLSPVPSPTAITTPNAPTPTPTPTSSGCQTGCYDSSRNTACFNIPSTLAGNETRGSRLWPNCAGCHTESSRRNIRYDQISNSLTSVSEMLPFSDSFSNQDIADLAAYLNRFNPKQCRSNWP